MLENFPNYYLPLCTLVVNSPLVILFRLCLAIEIWAINNVCQISFHLEDMIYHDSFRTSSVIDIIQELFQVKGFFMGNVNNFNIISGIKSFTALHKSKEIFFRHSALKLLEAWSQSLFVWSLIYK